jgi:hypothetical protein
MAFNPTPVETESYNTTSLRRQGQVLYGQYNIHPYLDAQKGAMEDQEGGDLFTFPVEFVDHSEPTELVTGYEQPNMNVQTTIDLFLQYQWWFACYPASISIVEEKKNRGGDNLIKLQEKRIENIQKAAMRKMETHLLQGGVTAHSRLNTLNGVDYPAGLFEAAAPAAQTHTVGGLVRTTYATYPLLGNQFYDVGGSVNARGFDALAQVDSYIETRAPDATGTGEYVASELCKTAFGRLANARVMEMKTGSDTQEIAPPTKLMVHGKAIRSSPFMPIAGASSATTQVSMYRFNPKDQPLMFMKDMHFELQGWMPHPTQLTLNNFLLIGAQQMLLRGASGALFANAQAF